MSAGPAPVVVKLGGTTIAEEQGVLAEIAERSRHQRIVVVHGGGGRLTDWLDRLGIPTRFHEGKRVTDDAAMEVALAVLRGLVNVELVAALRALGCDAVGLSGVDGGLLVGDRQAVLGRVVTAPRLQGDLIHLLLDHGSVPVIAPLALDQRGVVCNVNADDAAAGIAAGLGAMLVLLTDTEGVRGAVGTRIPTMTFADAEHLIATGAIAGGMVPKVRAAAHAATAGSVSVIADGRRPGALALAIDGQTSGTRVLSG